MDGTKTRGLPVAIAECAVILAAVALLGSYQSTTRYALATEAGEQQTDADPYAKMREQTFSEEQWLKMLHERVHQPLAVWRGIETGTVEADSSGMSISGLQFENSVSGVLEHHLMMNGLMARHPLMFLPFFEDRDPEIVLTGVAAYRLAMMSGEFRPEELGKETTDRIVEAIRAHLLGHRDVRVRCIAATMLGDNRWMTPQDIEVGLNDHTDAVRLTTVFYVDMMRSQWSWESDPDNQESASGARLTRAQFQERDSLLAETLLNHVNDTHFYIRETAGGTLRAIFMRRLNDREAAGASVDNVDLPEQFDWIRSDWQKRCATQEAWKQWWARHGTIATP
jgi:hypothetical protein